jgi:hypothetical protein
MRGMRVRRIAAAAARSRILTRAWNAMDLHSSGGPA